MIRYGSVCSGIEAATVAWHSLGWVPSFFSEIEKFPREVLAHHYPDVPLHGDFTTIGANQYGSIDLLVGGTPCQSFSIAGLRKGMDDDRGNLALEFIKLAQRTRPRWVVWENVPGVLSSNRGRDFGAFLGGLGEIGYGFAYRVLDAQFFGLAQRRKRVFVVGYLGDWRRSAAVLFERHSMSGNPAPSREARKELTESIEAGARGSDLEVFHESTAGSLCARTGRSMSVQDAEQNHIVPSRWPAQIASTLNAAFGDKQGLEDQHALGGASWFVPAMGFQSNANACDAMAAGKEVSPTMRASDSPAVAFHENSRAELRETDIAGSISTLGGKPGQGYPAVRNGMAVRRLTPIECERLQGFPDGYTDIKDRCPDGPRYKALGNSMAVPVMRWIGERIQMMEDLCQSEN